MTTNAPDPLQLETEKLEPMAAYLSMMLAAARAQNMTYKMSVGLDGSIQHSFAPIQPVGDIVRETLALLEEQGAKKDAADGND